MLVTASGALAQQYVNPCEGDIAKFCGNIQPGKGYIADCLSRNEAQLSSECRSLHLADLSEVMRKAQQACEADILKFCPSERMQPGMQLMKCMWGFRSSLTPECNKNLLEALELMHY
jgi:hypothetical protein